MVADEQLVIRLASNGADAMFGYAPGELVGLNIEALIPERSRDVHRVHVANFSRRERSSLKMDERNEVFALRKDGTEFPIEISLSPLRTEDGLLVSSAIRDVTERKKIEMAIAVAHRELEAFSYSVAHDLRAPLRAMSGFAQILLEDYRDKLGLDGLDCLQEIHSNAIRMGALIDALLSLSRVTRGELKPERVDLTAIARSIVAQLAAAEPERSVEVVIREQLQAYIDPALARTLLQNLLGNAWKFTSKVANARIEFTIAEDEGTRAFVVRDNGAGFNMQHAGKLFSPFQRMHTVGEFPGTGIGLATAQRIVHRHNGRIWARGSVGAGAAFYFTLSAL